jgi:hypothetical protein
VAKLNPWDWIVVAGGALVLVAGVGRWFSWEVRVEEVREASDTTNAFDYLLTGVVPWLLVVGAAVVTLLLATGALNPGKVPWPLVILAATALGFVLILIRLIIGHDLDTGEGAELHDSRGWGIWVSALGALIAAVGAFIGLGNAEPARSTARPMGPASSPPRPEGEIPPPTA